MKKRDYFRIISVILILFVLYIAGIPIYTIIFFGIFMIILLVFKTKLYKKLDYTIRKKFPLLSKFPEWAVRAIIIIIFILIYLLLKQVIFELLKLFGLDVRQVMLESINQSTK